MTQGNQVPGNQVPGSNAFFHLLVESATEFAIVSLDTEGRFNTWNTGAERLLGYSEQEALGLSYTVIFNPEDRDKHEPEKELEAARQNGRAQDDHWHVKKDGSRFWGSGVISPMYDDAGVLQGYAKVLRDRTKQKRFAQRLEEQVAQRTAELASLSEQQRDLLQRIVTTQEDERRRLSRELHDSMGQQLTALLLGLRNLKTFSTLPDALAATVPLEALVKEIAEEIHNVSFALRPTALDDLGLLPALNNFVSQWSRWNSIPVDTELIGWDATEATTMEKHRLPGDVETTIYRIVQEALTNVSRHASTALRVSLVFQRSSSEVRVVVEDDGPGFDAEAQVNQPPQKRRLGLFGMQERATLVGGETNIESEPGKGTSVFVRIPLAT